MPLAKGQSTQTIQGNIEEILNGYKSTGRIGNITPRSDKHARDIASAMAYKQAGKAKTTMGKM